jgi:phosphate transport system substrate-binding protein
MALGWVHSIAAPVVPDERGRHRGGRMHIAGFGWSAIVIVLAALLGLAPGRVQAEVVRIGGSGLALAAMRSIGDEVAKAHPEIETQVLPSLGSQGGTKALIEGEIEVAIVARKLKPDEAAHGIREAACATTALIFASSRQAPAAVTRGQLPAIYAEPNPTWPDGSQLKVILRSRAGSENPYLIAALPALEAALAAAYRRPGMPVGSTDQENAELAQRTVGSFAVMTLLQLRTEGLALHPLALDGVEPSPETIASGAYPMPFRFCLIVPAQPTPGAAQLLAYFESAEGAALLRRSGAEPSR